MKLTMYRGDSALWIFNCKQSNGSPLDVSAGDMFFTAKSSTRQTDLQAIFQKTIGSGITIVDGVNGTISVELDTADTSAIYAPAILKWDLQYVTTGGKAYTLLAGDLLVNADVTSDIS